MVTDKLPIVSDSGYERDWTGVYKTLQKRRCRLARGGDSAALAAI